MGSSQPVHSGDKKSNLMVTVTSDSKSNPTPSRLFIRFAAFGLIAFLVLALVLFQLWMRTFERHLVDETKETRARYTNALVGHMLTGEDFREIKKGEDWKAFRNKISDLFSLPEVVRVKVYNQEGNLIWSDSLELMQVSPQAKKNPQLLSSLEGRIEANISHLQKEEHRFERGTFRTLMELYVPIYFEPRDKPVGVMEVYLNIDPLFATIRNTRWLIGLTVIGGLVILLSISFLGLGRAVIVIHKQNRDLRDRLEEIFKATRMKNDLLANLSHEVRNPDAIMSYANLLLDGAFWDQPEKVKRTGMLVDKMRNTAAEILSHFTRIVELSRLKVGDVQPQREPVEMTELLRDITSDLCLLCVNGTVACKVEVPPDPVVINADRSLIQQVVFNLLSNAIKFTPKGKVCLRLEEGPEKNEVKVVVEDTGVGIKPEELPMIFDEFYRGNHPGARFKSGVGLGLAIVKKSLELLGGKIQVESVYGVGSKFTVSLPRTV